MSLSFSDEHLAWQQRINKEKFAATITQYLLISPNKPLKSPIKVYDSRDSTPKPHMRPLFNSKQPNRLRLSSLDQAQGRLPNIYSRDSCKSHSKYSVNSSQMGLSEFDEKSVDQLKEILKQERIVRSI